ncbi:MAG: transposase [Candidatus Hydrogenedentota bacterium]|nr:MAG: transposase [Candidatus Hydrogenedentota bacterium]
MTKSLRPCYAPAMARPLRIEYAGAVYHVTSRGNERKAIFRDDKDREKFFSFLSDLPNRFGVVIHGFVLMGNHYHVLLETRSPNLQRAMHYLNTAYTVYFNRRRRRAGHVLQGRYKAFVIDKDSYLLSVSRYLHLNPVRAGMVSRPEEYPWSSYREYIGKGTRRGWLTCDWVLEQFSKDPARARHGYKEFVEDAAGGSDNPFASLKAGLVLGSERFFEEIKRKLSVKKDSDVPQTRHFVDAISCDAVIRFVAACHGVEEREITGVGGWGSRARRICLYLLREFTDMSNAEIAARFQVSPSAVRKACTRLKEDLEHDNALRSFVRECERALSNFKV